MTKCINCYDEITRENAAGFCSGGCKHEHRSGKKDDTNNKKGGSLKLDRETGQGAAR